MPPPVKKPPRPFVRPSPEGMGALLRQCDLSLSSLQIEQLWKYHQYLRQFDTELNLTRIHNFENMVLKLYADSILPGRLTDLPSPLLDLGTGPGMPGIPLKIAFPHLEILLAESRRKRREFLQKALDHLQLNGISVLPSGITSEFDLPVPGVITRAVEVMKATLERVTGCLEQGGRVIFMKGPNCGQEIAGAVETFASEYQLVQDLPYRIPQTPHERRLVVFERLSAPARQRKAVAMERHAAKRIESEHNDIFKDLKKLLSARGIKKQGRALVSGSKVTAEILKELPGLCEAWITSGDHPPPPENAPVHLQWVQLTPSLFQALDVLGTHDALLRVKPPPLGGWDPALGLPDGCSLLVPFQDPENVGAVIRSAAAFGVRQTILLSESAHPYHPKAVRASGGAVFRIKLLEGPSLNDLPDDSAIVSLSAEGENIAAFKFPPRFALLPGLEGPGLPERFRRHAMAIPISSAVESLNAATATAVALYVWSQQTFGEKPE